MKIAINQTYFVSRVFPYLCSYKDILKKLSAINKKPTTDSVYVKEIVDQFLFHNEFSFSKTIIHYSKQGINSLTKADYVVFFIDNALIKKCFNTLIFSKNERLFYEKEKDNKTKDLDQLFNSGGIRAILKNYENTLNTLINNNVDNNLVDINYWRTVHENLKSLLYTTNSNYEDYDESKAIDNLIDDWARYKHEFLYHQDIIYSKSYKFFKEIDKRLHEIAGYDDVKNLLNDSDYACIAVVSKLGMVNFSFVFDFDLRRLDKDHKKFVIEELPNSETAKIKALEIYPYIRSYINKMPKLYNYIDFNYLLGFDSNTIIDNMVRCREIKLINGPSNEKEKASYIEIMDSNHKKCRYFLDRFSCNKCIHLRFVADDDWKDSEQVMFFYDYLSLLVAYNYSYDSYYLWSVVQKDKSKLEPDDRIKDYIAKPTEHMYIDNMCVLISQINPVIQHNRLDNLLRNGLMTSSHQSRIYSFWNYAYSCNASCFGTFTSLSYHLLDAISTQYFATTYWKVKIAYRLQKFSYISSLVESHCSVRYYSTKVDNIEIVKPIFEHMNLYELSLARGDRSKELWQNGNLSLNQLYNRYSIVMSVIGLLITIVSFGLVSAIFCSTQSVTSPFDFFQIVFSTPKFYFIILISLIPVLVFLALTLFGCILTKKLSIVKEAAIFNEIDTRANVVKIRHNEK